MHWWFCTVWFIRSTTVTTSSFFSAVRLLLFQTATPCISHSVWHFVTDVVSLMFNTILSRLNSCSIIQPDCTPRFNIILHYLKSAAVACTAPTVHWSVHIVLRLDCRVPVLPKWKLMHYCHYTNSGQHWLSNDIHMTLIELTVHNKAYKMCFSLNETAQPNQKTLM